MSLKPDDFPINDDGTDAFLHGVVITFDGKDEWSLYDDSPQQPPAVGLPVPEANADPKTGRFKDQS
jgi:hypothetical protein